MNTERPTPHWKEKILPEWSDYNGHMNVAYYTLIFDHAIEAFYPLVGLGKDYRGCKGKSTFAVEGHTSYLKEVNVGQEVSVGTQLLGYDEKRIHYFHEMRNTSNGQLVATLEQLSVHVDLELRKVVPMPEVPRSLLAKVYAKHSNFSKPPQVASVISFKRK